MQVIIYYDYCAFVLLAVMLIYLMCKKRFQSDYNDIFRLILVIVLACTFCDIGRQNFEVFSNGYSTTKLIFHSLFLIFESLIAPAYFIYVIYVTGTKHMVRQHLPILIGVTVPICVSLLGLMINFFTPIIFSFDGDGKYVRMSAIYGIFGISGIYLVMIVLYLMRFRKLLGRRRFISLVFPIPLILIGSLVEMIFSNQRILMFTIAVAFLEVIVINSRIEMLIDLNTGFGSAEVFAEEINAGFVSHRHMYLLLVNVTNYHTALNSSFFEEVQSNIAELANILKRIGKNNSIKANYYYLGNGEFVIVFDRLENAHIDEKAKIIFDTLSQEKIVFSSNLEFSLNICLVKCPEDAEDADTIYVLSSDLKNYPNSTRILSAADFTHTESFRLRKEMNYIIDRAIVNNYLSVYYQPIYSAKDKRFKSSEALVRLNDPDYGFVSPGIFIPIAEKSGAIHRIGSFVLEEVCKFIASDDFKRLNLDYVEVNLSAMQCLRSDLTDELMGLVKKYKISPSSINLEITETASCYSQESMIANIHALHDNGFEISLDDFGTGYSNLMRITSLPLNIVKLDRAFVIMEEDPEFRAIILNIMAMFKELGLHILVEGIETEKLANDFIGFGVDYIQGYYYSRPLPKNDYIKFLEEHL